VRIKNEALYPKALIAFLKDSLQRPSADILRVTELYDAPFIKKLLIENWEDLTLDPEKHIPALMGTAWHVAMEKYAPAGESNEQRIFRTLNGVQITGQPDIVTPTTIEDHKTASVVKYLMKDFSHWTGQLNTYAWLLQVKPKYLTVWAVFKDWTEMAHLRNPDYPPRRLMKIPIPKYSLEATEAALIERIAIHTASDIPYCTPEERWQTEDTYAIKKEGRKTAVRVLDTIPELHTYAQEHDIVIGRAGYSVEKRPGVCKRCKDWCMVSEFCPLWKQLKKEMTPEAT